ncbi:DUF6266 family protein [Pedobacter sp. AW31-3R]|uniref:DUF6266 family protein n=1 Tax=Pedobacter sp. AW31-3R TaxID=3445781 RepID=UPI003FA17FC0
MAISPFGILGGFSGKVGTVVGRDVKGKNIMSSKPKKRKKGNKKYQNKGNSAQQEKLALMSSFLKRLKGEIEMGFARAKAKAAPISYAMKFNLKHAVKTTEGGYEINFAEVKLSEGKREPAWSEDITFEKGRKVRISWDMPDTVDQKLFGNDQAYMIIYQVESGWIDRVLGKAIRADLEYVYTVPRKAGVGQIIHGWIFFVSPDGKEVSDSHYLGSGILLA